MEVLLIGVALQLAIATAAWVSAPAKRLATTLGVGACLTGCLLGLGPALHGMSRAIPESVDFSWDRAHGPFTVAIDPLSAFFLVPLLGLSALAAIYGASYLEGHAKTKSLGCQWFFFNLFVAGMVMVLIARTVLLFLMAWEVMSISAYFLVTFEHEKATVRKAGWVYLIAAHIGVAFLFLVFLLLARNAGSLAFEAFRTAATPGAGWCGLIFVLALVGFGTKAGFVPFHIWLPEAHPAAPSHVSALMSGVMIKLGLYGLLRVLTFLGQPAAWWGMALFGLGLLSALVGIALAICQRDIKRVLAYSSIENVGLIGMALGVSVWGWANAFPVVAFLGLAAGLLHIWNHALMKGLMFFGAGSILHGTGTDDMEKLGGLMHTMPWTACTMMVGSVAIAALPPFNGFVSKWLMYVALLKFGLVARGNPSLALFFATGLVALVGGLAAIAFVRLAGIILLGSPRSAAARHAHKSSPWLIAPMLICAVLCFLVGILPAPTLGLLTGPLEQILRRSPDQIESMLDSSEVPLHTLGMINLWTLAAVSLLVLAYTIWSRKTVIVQRPTWGCGYLAPSERMQYTGRSFAEMLSGQLLPHFLRPQTNKPVMRGFFPSSAVFNSEYHDPVSERVYEPFFRRWGRRFSRMRILQQGKVHVYLVYILLTVVVALAWVSLRSWWGF